MAFQLSERKFISQQSEEKLTSQDKIKFLRVLRSLQVLLQFLVVIPIVGRPKLLLYLQWIWCTILLLIVWGMCIQRSLNMEESMTTIERALLLSELIFNSILPLNIFIMSFSNKEKFIFFIDKFKCLNEQLNICSGSIKHPCTPIYRKLRQELLLLIIGLLIFYLYCLVNNLLHNHDRVIILLEEYGTYHLPNIIITANLIIYWLSLRFIALAISYSNNILQSFQEPSRIFNSASLSKVSRISTSLWFEQEFGSFSYKKSTKFYDIFITLTEIYFELDQLMRQVIDIFRNVLLMNFVNSFFILVLQFFAVYKYFVSKNIEELMLFLLDCSRLWIHTFNIIFILLSNNAICNQKCQTIYILNSLSVETMEMEKSISSLLLQLMVRKHTLYVGDILELDLAFLLGIASALSSYVTFLIQIHLGVDLIEDSNITHSGEIQFEHATKF